MALQIEMRPTTFDEVVGNAGVVKSLKAFLKRDRKDIPHAFLFSGESGCGKTTLARILAKELGCEGNDFLEINAANNRGIDTVRGLVGEVKYKPLSGSCKVYLLDEVGKVTNDAQNALLKVLEDCPEHVYFMLCTTEPEKLLKTVRNRCSSFVVSKLKDKEMGALLLDVLKKKDVSGLSVGVSSEIIKVADGCPRQALVLLDQVVGLESEEALAVVQKSTIESPGLKKLCQLLLRGDFQDWDKVVVLLKGLEEDPEKARRMVLGYFNAILLNTKNKYTNPSTMQKRCERVLVAFYDNFFDVGKPGLTLACYTVLTA